MYFEFQHFNAEWDSFRWRLNFSHSHSQCAIFCLHVVFSLSGTATFTSGYLMNVCVCVCESFRAQECLLTTQALHTILTYIARNVSHSFYSFFSGPTSLWLSCHRRFLCVCCCLCCRCLIFCCVVGEMGLDQRMNA